MAFQLAEAYVQLGQRGLSSLTGAIGSVRSSLGGLVSLAGGPLGVALAGLGAGAGAAGMIKMAADAEQLQVAFGTMLGSADKAKAMIADLTQFAAKTPFSMPGITQAARTLLAFGQSQDQVIPLLQVLGDVAAGTGKDLAELSVIFGQISATGKLTGGDLMQLTNAGVPILKVLGDQLGKTTGEIKQMVEDGEISSGMVTKAFQAMSAEGGLFAGMMEKQSGTLGGLWSTLQDTVGQGMVAIGQALVDGFDLKNVIANFTSFVEKVRGEWMPSIVASIRWVGDNMVKPFFSAIGSMATFLFDFVRDFDLYWEYAYTSVGNWMNNIYQVVSTGMSNAWTITKWFFSNFFGIAANVFLNLPKLFMNYVQLIINQWKGVLNFFRTGKIEIDWSPLQEAAKLIFKDIEMPKLETAQTDALRPDLERIEGQLAKRQQERQKKQTEAKKEEGKEQESALKIAEEQQKTGEKTLDKEKELTKEKEKQQGSFSGLAELADKMQMDVLDREKQVKKEKADNSQAAKKAAETAGLAAAAIAGGPAGVGALAATTAGASTSVREGAGQSVAQATSQTSQIDSLSRQVTALETLLSLAQGSGLRVAMQQAGGVSIPAASLTFGATGS